MILIKQTQDIGETGQTSALINIDPDDVSRGIIRVFPAEEVERLALCLARVLDCYVSPTEAEAAVVAFVKALEARGWKVCLPAASAQHKVSPQQTVSATPLSDRIACLLKECEDASARLTSRPFFQPQTRD